MTIVRTHFLAPRGMSVVQADAAAEKRHTSALVSDTVNRGKRDVCELLYSQAESLLTRVVIRLAGEGPHLVRFLSLGTGEAGRHIAQAFCKVAAEVFGNILFADFRLEGAGRTDPGHAVVHDAEVPRLFYGRLSASSLDIVRRGRLALLDGAHREEGRYDMLVIDMPYDSGQTEIQTMSPIFTTTVLVAAAGYTPYRQIRRAYETVHGAGGHVLGVALMASSEPAWLRRWFQYDTM